MPASYPELCFHCEDHLAELPCISFPGQKLDNALTLRNAQLTNLRDATAFECDHGIGIMKDGKMPARTKIIEEDVWLGILEDPCFPRITWELAGTELDFVWRRDPISYNEENLRELAAASAALEQTATVIVADPSEALPPTPSAAMDVVETVPVIAPGNHNHGPLPNPPPPQGTTDTLPGEPTTPTPAQEQHGGSRTTPPPVPSEEQGHSEGWEDIPDIGSVSRRPGRTRMRGRQPGVP
ncbi:hypothetical protein RUND412_008527 [Rhizina undulata]